MLNQETSQNSVPTTPVAATDGAPRFAKIKRALPAHWQRGRQLAALLIFCCTVLFTYAGRMVGRADQLDSWWLGARFSTREALRPSPLDPEIVLVEMDDKSLSQWPEPTIAWGAHFAAAVNRMVAGGAKVIAFDWLQPESTTKYFNQKFSQNDTLLAQALAKAPNVVMVKLSPLNDKSEWIKPTAELLYSLPHADPDPDLNLGYANFGYADTNQDTVRDSVVAALAPSVGGEDKPVVSFAARIAEHYYGSLSQLRDGSWTIPGKVVVPLRANNTLLLNYNRPSDLQNPQLPSGFSHYSLYDIAQPSTTPDTRFRNKIVIVGATYSGLNDQHSIPFIESGNNLSKARLVSGPEIQANFVRNLLNGQVIHEPGALVIWLLALVVSIAGLVAFYFMRWVPAALVAVGVAVLWIGLAFALFMTANYALPIMLPLLGLFLTSGLMGGYRALREERERAGVMSLWGRYQDPRLVEYLLQNPEARGGEGQEMIVTVLFADLKNFTKTVESLTPAQALYVLNRYLALLNDVIVVDYAGVVDKYLGDGLMAQWAAPEAWSESKLGQNHATAAVNACLEIDRRAQALTASMDSATDVAFSLRLTLHTGPVVVGRVGADRLEYTIIGDTVNVTSRLQETAKQLDCEFLISESTYEYVRDWVVTGKEAEVEIRGRQQPLRVYEILGVKAAAGDAAASNMTWQKGCQNNGVSNNEVQSIAAKAVGSE